MATKIVKNSSNQPIYLNLPGGRSLKIPARGEAEVEEEDAGASELALHLSRGNAVLIEPEGSAEQPEAATPEKPAAQEQKSETKTETGPATRGES